PSSSHARSLVLLLTLHLLFTHTTPTDFYTLSLHDALPIYLVISEQVLDRVGPAVNAGKAVFLYGPPGNGKTVIAEGMGRTLGGEDRKSTRLNSSHVAISYAVFCLKKKKEREEV